MVECRSPKAVGIMPRTKLNPETVQFGHCAVTGHHSSWRHQSTIDLRSVLAVVPKGKGYVEQHSASNSNPITGLRRRFRLSQEDLGRVLGFPMRYVRILEMRANTLAPSTVRAITTAVENTLSIDRALTSAEPNVGMPGVAIPTEILDRNCAEGGAHD